MAYNALNNLIDAYIYANGVQAITGQILNGVLKQMVSQLGSGYHLMGVAGPETTPEQNDFAMAYFAATAGEYTDFGGITLAAGEVAVLLTSGNGSWSKQTIYTVPTTTEDLENTANFITNAVTDLVNYYTKTEVDTTLADYPTLEALATALADYYTKTQIDEQKAVTDAALADRYTKSETDTKLADYYRKTETYDKSEVDSIVAALSRQSYVVAWDGLAAPDVSAIPAGVTVTYSGTTYTGTLAASASTVNKIYMVWNGTAYDMYGTSQDGGYSWVPMGTTSVDLSQYATKAEVSQLEAEVDALEDGYIIPPYTLIDGGINTNGSVGSGTTYKHTSAISVLKGQKVKVSTAGYGFALISKYEGGTYTPQVTVTSGDANVPVTYIWTATDDMSISVCIKSTIAYSILIESGSSVRLGLVEQELDGLVIEHFTRGGYINSGGTVTANQSYCYSDLIPCSPGISYTIDYGEIPETLFVVFYNSNNSKLDYWSLTSSDTSKTITSPANSAFIRFSFLPSYNAKVYQGDTLIWQAQENTPGLDDRIETLENEVSVLQTLPGEIDSVKDDVSKIAVDKNTIDYGIKAGYEFSRTSGTPLENITVSDTETGINIAKTGGTNLSFKIVLPKISTAGTYHIVFSSNKEMTSANIYKDGTYDSAVQATDNVCEFDYVYDGTYVLAIGTTMLYDKSSQDYSLIATVPNATGMAVLADNISERVQELEDSAQTPIPASVEGTNTFIGDGAGQNNTPIEGSDNGKYNTAVGKNAMLYNTLGDHCTALGFCALNKNQDGRNNTALGEDALYENLHGGQNVAIGQHSGQDSQGGYNVFIGSNAARRQATGDLNVVIGAEAYNDNAETGCSGAVLIGAYASNPDNYDNVIVIKGEAPTAAKQIRIGKADFSAVIFGHKKLIFNNDGTVTWEDVTPTP